MAGKENCREVIETYLGMRVYNITLEQDGQMVDCLKELLWSDDSREASEGLELITKVGWFATNKGLTIVGQIINICNEIAFSKNEKHSDAVKLRLKTFAVNLKAY